MSIDKLSEHFNKKQIAVWKYDQKYKPHTTILHGSVRSGKTYILLWLWINHILKYKGQNKKFIMMGVSAGSLKQNCLDDMEEFFGLDCSLNIRNEFELFGNTIRCVGGDNVSSYKAIRGFTAHGAFFNEITLLHENSIREALNRCSGNGARVYADTNPSNPNHDIKLNWVDKDGELFDDGTIRVKSWHFNIWDNAKSEGGFVDDKFIETLSKAMPEGFEKERSIYGKWVASEGVIYTSFRETMIVEEVPEFKYHLAGIDYGYEHIGAILVFGVDHDGNIYLIDETATRHREIDWWCDILKDYRETYPHLLEYADTARPEYVKKMRVRPANKEVVEGIELIQQLMKDGKFFVKKGVAPNFMREIYCYEWDKKATKDQPIKENDDSMDAMRYALYSHFKGRKHARVGNARLF